MVTTENGVIKPKDEIQELSFVRADELDSMQLEKPFFSSKRFFRLGCVLLQVLLNMEKAGLC